MQDRIFEVAGFDHAEMKGTARRVQNRKLICHRNWEHISRFLRSVVQLLKDHIQEWVVFACTLGRVAHIFVGYYK